MTDTTPPGGQPAPRADLAGLTAAIRSIERGENPAAPAPRGDPAEARLRRKAALAAEPSGAAESGPAESGGAESGPAESGVAESGPAESGPAESGVAESGVAEAPAPSAAGAPEGRSAAEAAPDGGPQGRSAAEAAPDGAAQGRKPASGTRPAPQAPAQPTRRDTPATTGPTLDRGSERPETASDARPAPQERAQPTQRDDPATTESTPSAGQSPQPAAAAVAAARTVLTTGGAPATLALDAVRTLGERAAETLEADPWSVLALPGVRPDQADTFARAVLGPQCGPGDPRRARALVAYLMEYAAERGHTALAAEALRTALAQQQVPDPAAAVAAAVEDGQVLVFRDDRDDRAEAPAPQDDAEEDDDEAAEDES